MSKYYADGIYDHVGGVFDDIKQGVENVKDFLEGKTPGEKAKAEELVKAANSVKSGSDGDNTALYIIAGVLGVGALALVMKR